MNTAVISLGSNLDPEKYIDQARQSIASHFEILKESTFVLTEPIGQGITRPFLNGSILVKIKMDRKDLKRSLKNIEKSIRQEAGSKGVKERVIDLDLTVWNNTVIHQDYHTRPYIEEAVRELLPKAEVQLS